jgi:hypothetical protein
MYGGIGPDEGICVVQTFDGGYAVGGNTRSFGVSEDDWYLIKTDAAGNMLWQNHYGRTLYWDFLSCMIQTSDEGYAMVGDGFANLAKTDSNGNLLWNKTYSIGSWLEPCSLIQTEDTGFALAGSVGNPPDYFLIKTNSTGSMLWNKIYDYGDSLQHMAHSMIQTEDGGYALIGDYLSLVKTDSLGNQQWTRTYGTYSGSDFTGSAFSIVQADDGGYAFTGYNYSQSILFKTSSNGDVSWVRKWEYIPAPVLRGKTVIQTDDHGFAIFLYGSNRQFFILKTDVGFGLAWKDSTANNVTLYRGATDTYWNYVRVRLWKPR